MVNWRNIAVGFANLLDNHDRDIEVNSTLNEDIEDSIRELRSVRAGIPQSEKHKLFKIDYDIGELKHKRGGLRKEREELNEDEN